MRNKPKDMLAGVEAAIADLASQISVADDGQGARVAALKDQLDALLAESAAGQASRASSLDVLRTELGKVREFLDERAASAKEAVERADQLERALTEEKASAQAAQDRVREIEDSLNGQTQIASAAEKRTNEVEKKLAEVSDAAQAAQRRIQQLERANEALEAKSAEAQSKLDALHRELEDAGKAQALLKKEQKRADALEKRLDKEASKGTKAAMAQELAEALQEAEAAQQEIARLQEELAAARATEQVETEQIATDEPPEEVVVVETYEREEDLPEEAAAEYAAEAVAAEENQEPEPVVESPEGEAEEADLKPEPKRRHAMGEALVAAGVISEEQLEELLVQQRKNPQRSLCAAVVELGYANEEAVARVVAERHGIDFIRLADYPEVRAAAELIGGRIARQHTCFPVATRDDSIVLAMVDPGDIIAIEDVERETGQAVEPVVATAADIAQAIEKHYT